MHNLDAVDLTEYDLEEVQSICVSEDFTVDIEVEEEHHYILKNGIVSHNSSVICDSISNGIEPVFLLEYERKTICSWPTGLNEDNVKKVLTLYKEKDYKYWRGFYSGVEYYYEPHNRGLCKINRNKDYGYQWLLDNYPDEDHSKYLVTTKELSTDDHINMQEVAQNNVNQSISKTVNLPNKYPFSKFKDLYLNAWKKGLIGLTTYREGSMESVLSDISSNGQGTRIIKKDIQLPETFVNGPTRIIKREGKKFYIHFSYLPGDEKLSFPVCMWIYSNERYKEKSDLKNCNKAARELAKLALRSGINEKIIEDGLKKAAEDYPHNRLGRMISLNLRHNVPRENILVALTGIEGDNISSLLTSVRKFLGETIPDGTELQGIKCSCGSSKLIIEAGCKRCLDCGSQTCG